MKKACLIRLSSLGDIVISTAVIPVLRASGYSVSFVTKPAFADLLASDTRISSVFIFDKKGAGGEQAARSELEAWLRLEQFQLIFDLHDSWRTWSWRKWLRRLAPVVVVKKPRFWEMLVILFRWRGTGLGAGGRAKRFRDHVWQALRDRGEAPLLDTNIPLTSLAMDPEVKKSLRIPREKYIVLAPGSAWPGKRWPEERFAELAAYFAKKYIVIVLGGAKENFCAQIAAEAAKFNSKSISLHGLTELSELVQIVGAAEFVVGNDTGIVHIADALSRPTIVIEGPTDARLGFSPAGDATTLIGKNLICRPCSKSGKICWRFGTRKCLLDVSTEVVISAAEAKINVLPI